jgi:hypothetical protein
MACHDTLSSGFFLFVLVYFSAFVFLRPSRQFCTILMAFSEAYDPLHLAHCDELARLH